EEVEQITERPELPEVQIEAPRRADDGLWPAPGRSVGSHRGSRHVYSLHHAAGGAATPSAVYRTQEQSLSASLKRRQQSSTWTGGLRRGKFSPRRTAYSRQGLATTTAAAPSRH